MIEIDAAWRAAHPLAMPTGETSKNNRGSVVVIGGARRVPGAVSLTAEAALRVGAGKVRIATLGAAAIALGVAMPECGIIGLAEDDAGEIVANDDRALGETLQRVDVAVIGPGMGDRDAAARMVRWVVPQLSDRTVLLLDGAAVAGAGGLRDTLDRVADRLILTPHAGEMASLMDSDASAVEGDPERAATDIASRFSAVVALKGGQTIVAAPRADPLHYAGGGVGLATGGSGDVLAGAIAGLAARGIAPREAVGWGVWLHGEAGRVLAGRHGPIGFLARQLPPLLTELLPR